MGIKKKLIKLFTFLGGIYFFLEFLLPAEISIFGSELKFGKYHQQISEGIQGMGAMAFGLGLINLFLIHGGNILYRRKGSFTSTALLLGFGIMTTITILDWYSAEKMSSHVRVFHNLKEFSDRIVADKDTVSDVVGRNRILITELAKQLSFVLVSVKNTDEQSKAKDTLVTHGEKLLTLSSEWMKKIDTSFPSANEVIKSELSVFSEEYRIYLENNFGGSTTKKIYNLLFNGLYTSLGSAMFSLLAFYIASAAYRAFRIRSVESSLMMFAALLVMLGQIPFGIWIWHGFPDVRLWLLTVPSTAAFRAIKIGASVAALIMAFRMWLSIESDSFREEKR